MKNYKLLPKITLWVLMLLGIVATIMFFAGGSNGSLEVAGDFLDIPRFTDLFLIWSYILLGIVIMLFVLYLQEKLPKMRKRHIMKVGELYERRI